MGPIDYTSAIPQGNPIADLQAQLQAVAQQRQQQALAQQYQAESAQAIKNPTPQAFAALALKYPQHREAFKQGWEQLNTTQQQSELSDASTLAAALHSGRSDVALSKIDQRIQTMDTGGQDTSTLKFLRQQIEADPQKAYGSVLHVLSGLPGGDKVLENLGKVGTEARAAELQPNIVRKGAADAGAAESDAATKAVEAANAPEKVRAEISQMAAQLGLTRAQTAQAQALTNKYGAETRKTLMELQQAGQPTAQQRFDAEAKLRGEYNTGTKSYGDVAESYRRLKASNNDAAGDLSLIYSYMKMLDPGSVVREGEFATAQNAAGVPERVRMLFNRALNGERLGDKQREQFTAQAGSLFSAAQKRESELRSGLAKVARSYGLNGENIFSGRISEADTATPNSKRPPIGSFDAPGES